MQMHRLFEIVYILLNKKQVPAKDFAQHFNVSTRTIYRDIDTLSLAGIPIYTEKGKGGGISLLPDFVLNKSILNANEQSEILNSLHGLSNIATPETTQVLSKLSTLFQKNATNWMDVDFSDWSFNSDYFGELKQAILGQCIVEFEYYNAYGQKTFRRIEPLQLWFKSRAWYIKGFCLTKEALRTYKLLRIKDLKITTEIFEPRDIPLHMEESTPDTLPPDITKLKIAPEMTYRIYDDFTEDMVEKQPDGSHIVSVRWPIDNWVHGYILSMGEHVEVLAPLHLRDTIKEKAEKILAKYDPKQEPK